MTNIHDIAKLSGYSAATVSRVINQRGYVSDKAREKIKSIIDQMDYVPNDVARDLSRVKTYNIGVVLPYTEHAYFNQMLDGIMSAAFKHGYRVLILLSNYEQDKELEFLEQLRRRAFDALIFTSHGLPLTKISKYLRYGQIVCCQDPGEVQIPAAYTQRYETYVEAFKWVKERGYSRIGLMQNRDYHVSATSEKTIAAYSAVFSKMPDPQMIVNEVMTYQDGYQAGKYYHQLKQQPDFVFCNSDDIATGFRQFYLDQKLSAPDFMGQEHQLPSQLLNFSTIDHQILKVGHAAMELAISGESKIVRIPSRFINRA
ncbi:LacI family DNA-binding transcriptional regulator [Companilactobacillus versmoldensis]|uniref:Transcriptional regulator n=1 Tax=Companilactobacillus versmoldensis DSM 14857 = KCTC 3814 TaxID=1423815 RepID=A0A0R1SFJ2_9LACO|nr:LacI family DNA-binding transcriptional regulator [Companilactobacillus versmoldensis]KRL68173.1 transcriptional regulator [Companilactobacillus versmoldensis DSM 14857 = KCTC 3814]